MQIPKKKPNDKLKKKICKEPGCGLEFWRHPIAKYCETHRDIKARVKIIKDRPSLDDLNLVINHENKEPVSHIFNCSLEGCCEPYEVVLFPKQEVYPKFCETHRNEFKRKEFSRLYKLST